MKLHIKNIKIHINIGLHNWEKVIKRLVIIEVKLTHYKTLKLIDDVKSFDKILKYQDSHLKKIEDNALDQTKHYNQSNGEFLNHIIDVSTLKNEIIEYCTNKNFDYVEDLVTSLKDHLILKFSILHCSVKAKKAQFLMNYNYSCEE